ncbi:MAG TPA: DUF2520 domain-containing protein [Gemmatimonadales bacterium]|nr:DUF2520 domain-containing protein [Gemmatimonadales bacterium]
MASPALRIAVVGAGRMGQGLGGALAGKGQTVTILGRRAQDVNPPFSLQADAWGPALRTADLVILATPDAAVAAVAAELAGLGFIDNRHVVLHLAGPLDKTILAPLEPTGAALGSFHPLQTVADPKRAAESLRGAYAGLEGDPRAQAMGARLAKLLDMKTFVIPLGAKAKYHAAAVLVANYTVGLLGVAQRIAGEAGIPQDIAGQMYQPLLQGAMANLAALGPIQALTGPIRRGDLATLRIHLAALSARDRELYRTVGLAVLGVARAAGLAEERAQQVEALLDGRS